MKKIYLDEDIFREKEILYLRDLVFQNHSYFNYDGNDIKVCKDKDYLKVTLDNGKSIEIKPRYVGHLNRHVGYHAYISNEIVDSKLRYDLRFVNDDYYGDISKIMLDYDYFYIIERTDMTAARICDYQFRDVVLFDNSIMKVNSKRGSKKTIYQYDFSKEEDLLDYKEDFFAQDFMKLYNKMKFNINLLKFSKKEMSLVINTVNKAISKKSDFNMNQASKNANLVNEEMIHVKK